MEPGHLPSWRIRFADDAELEVTTIPPVDRVGALALHPGAVTAEPIDRCRRCTHFCRPGLSDGYCGERADLPVVYGHLHELPADRGQRCKHFEERC